MEKTISELCVKLQHAKSELTYTLKLLQETYHCDVSTEKGREDFYMTMSYVEEILDDYDLLDVPAE